MLTKFSEIGEMTRRCSHANGETAMPKETPSPKQDADSRLSWRALIAGAGAAGLAAPFFLRTRSGLACRAPFSRLACRTPPSAR